MDRSPAGPTQEPIVAPPSIDSESPKPQRGRLALWIAGVAAGIVILIILGYAETVWLHRDLPQDRASRLALLAYPQNASGQAAVESTQLVEAAQDPALLERVIAKAGLHDPSTDQPWSPERLRSAMSVNGQCVQVTEDSGYSARGVLLVVVARGADAHETDDVIHEWRAEFQQQSETSFPGLTLKPVESLRGTYAICQ